MLTFYQFFVEIVDCLSVQSNYYLSEKNECFCKKNIQALVVTSGMEGKKEAVDIVVNCTFYNYKSRRNRY